MPDELKYHIEEIKLRGTYVNMAVDVDFLLAIIIDSIFNHDDTAIKSVPVSTTKNGNGKHLHKLTLFEKIEVCKYGLKTHHKTIYDSHLNDLNTLDILRSWRNLFAHQKMDFQNDSTVRFTELIANLKACCIDYDVKKLWQDLLEYRATIMNILNGLKAIIIPT